MRVPMRAVLGCLGVAGLALAGMGTLVVLNWDTVSQNLAEALDTRAEKTQATLFRWGEVMSISAQLRAHYGVDPDVTYDTKTGDRILSISLDNYPLPEDVTRKEHAREIAVFAIGRTKKAKQIDVVRVLFPSSSRKDAAETNRGSESYSFALDKLTQDQSPATDSASE